MRLLWEWRKHSQYEYKLFFAYIKNFAQCFWKRIIAGWDDIQIWIKAHMLQLKIFPKFCFSQGSKQWFIRCQLLFWVKSAMECTGKKLACLKAGKRLLWSLACWTNFFSFSPMGVALVFTKKKQQREPITRRRLPWRLFCCLPKNMGCTWRS